jgi:glycosyltransferase involved in cell wall biosynthesis
VYTGTLALERGIGSVFQALSRLPDLDKLQLLITGEGKALSALKREVSRLGISEHVSFLGWLTTRELNALLCLADIGLEPYSRPWPQDHTPSGKVASYVAAGLFVLATDAPGYSEIITDRKMGYLYENAKQLQSFLSKCINYTDFLKGRTSEIPDRGGEKVDIVPQVDSLESMMQSIVNDRAI